MFKEIFILTAHAGDSKGSSSGTTPKASASGAPRNQGARIVGGAARKSVNNANLNAKRAGASAGAPRASGRRPGQ